VICFSSKTTLMLSLAGFALALPENEFREAPCNCPSTLNFKIQLVLKKGGLAVQE
jgi:hypothetical protein